MKYSKNWLFTDIVLIVSFLPLLFILPLLVQLSFIVGMILILKDHNYSKAYLILGLIAVVISFFGIINIMGIPKFANYIKALVSLLIIATVSQRLLKERSIFLSLSPYLFFAFSIIFFQNIYMLFYIIFEIIIFLTYEIDKTVKDITISFKKALKYFLFAAPIAAIIFMIFPRYSLKSKKIGFTSSYVLSGFSDTLQITSSQVFSTNRVVMEIEFDKKPKNLYFKGSVLYKNIGNRWIYQNSYQDYITNAGDKIDYKAKLYPTNQNYIFTLDIPFTKPKNSNFTPYYTIQSNKPIKDILNMRLSSYQRYKLISKKIPSLALEYDKSSNIKTQEALKKIKKVVSDEKRLSMLIKFFKNQKVAYTTAPPKYDTKNSVDEFFNLKRGYCVHFTNAFAISARMVGLPSRAVSGFLGEQNDMYKNYIAIREKDAHAWVEIYTKKRGWIRVDATKFAHKTITQSNNTQNREDKNSFYETYMMYVKFKIEQWVLFYDSYKQEKLMQLLKNKEFLTKFILSFIAFLFMIGLSIYKITHTKSNIEDRLIKKLIKDKPNNQTIYNYLNSFNDSTIHKINNLYHKIKFYKYTKKDLKELKSLVKKVKKVF